MTTTIDQFGQKIYKIEWGVPPCDHDPDSCHCEPQWFESDDGHAWAVWDSDWGWMPAFYSHPQKESNHAA